MIYNPLTLIGNFTLIISISHLPSKTQNTEYRILDISPSSNLPLGEFNLFGDDDLPCKGLSGVDIICPEQVNTCLPV